MTSVTHNTKRNTSEFDHWSCSSSSSCALGGTTEGIVEAWDDVADCGVIELEDMFVENVGLIFLEEVVYIGYC